MTTLTDEEIEKTETLIFDLAFDYQMEYGVDISVVVKNKDQFEYWLGALPFYNNIGTSKNNTDEVKERL